MRIKFTLLLLLFSINLLFCQTTIDFDNVSNWTAGSGGITSYQTDHIYTSDNWVFTGGPALRNTNAPQDGFPGALGIYAWRLRDANSVVWSATFQNPSPMSISQIGFTIRRWDGSPSPDYDVSISTNGGGLYTSIFTINNTTLNNSSDWVVFSYDLPTPITVSSGDLIVKFQSNGTTERILIDDYTFTASMALPVVLANGLELKTLPNELVIASWTTLQEVNNSHFEILHSTDGRTFNQIGEVTGFGTTNESKNYNFVHNTPSMGINYYKLVQVDYDGRFAEFNVKTATIGSSAKGYIYPTAIENGISLMDFESREMIYVYNNLGQLVKKSSFVEFLDMTELPAGKYTIIVGNQHFGTVKL